MSRWSYGPVAYGDDNKANAELLSITNNKNLSTTTIENTKGLSQSRAQNYGTTTTKNNNNDRNDRVHNILFGSSSTTTTNNPSFLDNNRSGGEKELLLDAVKGGLLSWNGNSFAQQRLLQKQKYCGHRLTGIGCFGLSLFLFIIIITILTVIGYFAVAPGYIKDRIAATNLQFTSLSLRNPILSSVQNNNNNELQANSYSLYMDIQGILSGLEPVDGELGAFTATLRYNNMDIATLPMPSLQAKAGIDNYIGFTVPVSILSLSDFAIFGDAMVNQNYVTAELYGITSVSTDVLGTKVSVNNIEFKKSVTFRACGGLKQSSVTTFSLARSNSTTAIVDLVVSVYNPSIIGIMPLGDIGTRIYYKGYDMGTAQAINATLLPGITNISLTGILVSSNTSITDELISAYLGNRPVTVTAKGEALPSSIPLYAPVLGALTLQASLNGSALPLVAGIDVQGMYLEPLGTSAVGVYLNVTVSVNNLLGANSPITVKSIALNCSLEGQGQNLGDLYVPETIVNGSSVESYNRALALGDINTLPFAPSTNVRILNMVHSTSQDDPSLPLLNITLSLSAVLSLQASDTKFADFVLQFLQLPQLSIGLVSSASNSMIVNLNCVLGDLTVGIPIAARTEVTGIGGFPYVSVDDFSVTGVSTDTTAPPAILTAITVSILNPSPASFTLGANATLGLYVNNQRLGYSTIYNETLEPGLNTLNLVGIIAPPASALPDTSALFSEYLAGINGQVQVVGEEVNLGPGLITPSWLTAAVQNISLTATLPGLDSTTAANLLINTTVQELSLDFGADGMSTSPSVGAIVRAVLQLPFTIPVNLSSTNVSLLFIEPDTNIIMATLDLNNQTAKWYPCSTNDECNAIQPLQRSLQPEFISRTQGTQYVNPYIHAAKSIASLFSSTGRTTANNPVNLVPVGVLYLNIGPGNMQVQNAAAFSNLISQALQKPIVSLRLNGTASPIVQTAIGNLNIQGVRISQIFNLQGMNALRSPPIVVAGGDITNTSAKTVSLTVTFNITNPAPIYGRLGPVTVGISYQNATFISSYLPAFTLDRGVNSLSTDGTFVLPDSVLRPTDYYYAKDALSRFLRGLSSNVSVVGLPNSTPNPLLKPAFASFVADASFPGMNDKLV